MPACIHYTAVNALCEQSRKEKNSTGDKYAMNWVIPASYTDLLIVTASQRLDFKSKILVMICHASYESVLLVNIFIL